MAEIFYGPWNVRLAYVDPGIRQRFKITGSDNADGRYPVAPGQVVSLDVIGEAWSVLFESEPSPAAGGENWDPRFPPHVEGHPELFPDNPAEQEWDPRLVKRTSRIAPPAGLIVQLDAISLPRLSLICTCMDPAVNPNPGGNPFDFTLPG